VGVLELIQQKAFVGKEFLTWLWFRAETDPQFELGGKRNCEIAMLDPIELDAHYGDARSTTLKGQSPATSPEAATALRHGKKLLRTRLKLSSDGLDWIAAINGETFDISGLNLPRPGRLPFEEGLRLRMEFLSDFDSMLSDLFNIFLEQRLDEKLWKNELEKIQGWVGEK